MPIDSELLPPDARICFYPAARYDPFPITHFHDSFDLYIFCDSDVNPKPACKAGWTVQDLHLADLGLKQAGTDLDLLTAEPDFLRPDE